MMIFFRTVALIVLISIQVATYAQEGDNEKLIHKDPEEVFSSDSLYNNKVQERVEMISTGTDGTIADEDGSAIIMPSGFVEIPWSVSGAKVVNANATFDIISGYTTDETTRVRILTTKIEWLDPANQIRRTYDIQKVLKKSEMEEAVQTDVYFRIKSGSAKGFLRLICKGDESVVVITFESHAYELKVNGCPEF